MLENEYKKLRETLTSVSGYMRQVGRIDKMEQLEKQLDRIQNSATTILVCGEFKRGKSTFVNALIGRNICPTDVDICTSVVSVIKYGLEEKVTRTYGDFSNLKYEKIEIVEKER